MKRRPTTTPPRRFGLRNRLTVIAASLVAFSLAFNLPAGASNRAPASPLGVSATLPSAAESGPENYDIRRSPSKNAQVKMERLRQKMGQEGKGRKSNRGQLMKAAREQLGPKAGGLRIKESEFMAAPEIVGVGMGRRMLTARSGEAREKVVRSFLTANERL